MNDFDPRTVSWRRGVPSEEVVTEHLRENNSSVWQARAEPNKLVAIVRCVRATPEQTPLKVAVVYYGVDRMTSISDMAQIPSTRAAQLFYRPVDVDGVPVAWPKSAGPDPLTVKEIEVAAAEIRACGSVPMVQANRTKVLRRVLETVAGGAADSADLARAALELL